jgi:hypothetical protein
LIEILKREAFLAGFTVIVEADYGSLKVRNITVKLQVRTNSGIGRKAGLGKAQVYVDVMASSRLGSSEQLDYVNRVQRVDQKKLRATRSSLNSAGSQLPVRAVASAARLIGNTQ